MKCLIKNHHRHLIYSFLFVAFLSFLSVVGFASDSYATSSSCTLTLTDYIPNSSQPNLYFGSTCSGDPVYYSLKSFDLTFTTVGQSNVSISRFIISIYSSSPVFNMYLYRDNSTTNFSVGNSYTYSNSSVDFVWPNFYFLDSVPTSYTSLPYIYFTVTSSQQSNLRINGSIVLEYSSSLSDLVGDSEPCPEVVPCPPIPENPYDQKLDDIKRAILTVGAILIMIYFFICLYKIVVKDGGSRK